MRTPEAEELWKRIEAKRKAWREQNPEPSQEIVCPYSTDMACYSECPDNKNRACVNGAD